MACRATPRAAPHELSIDPTQPPRSLDMKLLLPIGAIAIAAVVAAVILIGGGSTQYGASRGAAAPAPGAAGGTIRTTRTGLGTYLVDGRGRTLYLFEADKPGLSNCSSACRSIWPPLAAAGKAPAARGGAAARKLGTTKAGDGRSLVTYDGHPLYYYAGDQKPGDTKGQDLDQFGAGWYVVTPAGDKIDEG
jgi:predicted lipoprotein with Yx(FWY)xxD motif